MTMSAMVVRRSRRETGRVTEAEVHSEGRKRGYDTRSGSEARATTREGKYKGKDVESAKEA